MSYALAHIEGNLTEAPKALKINGKDAVEINIATNFVIKGETQANFFRVIFFDPNEIAFITSRGTKGSPITVLADIRMSKKENVSYTNYLGIRVLQLFTRTDPTSGSATVPTPAPAPSTPTPTPPPAPTQRATTPGTTKIPTNQPQPQPQQQPKKVEPNSPNDNFLPIDDDLPF